MAIVFATQRAGANLIFWSGVPAGPSDLGGAVALDPAVAAGSLQSNPAPTLTGDVALDPVVGAGSLQPQSASVLTGDAGLDPVALDGTLTGDTSELVGKMADGLRIIAAGRGAAVTLAPLDVAEVDNLVGDFSKKLPPDDPVIDVGVTCEVRVGTDPAAKPLLYGLWQIDDRKVRQRIVGARGLAGRTYLVRITAVSASGRVLIASGFIKVVRQS